MINSTPMANAMDRLSDWVGSLVPGCSRLGTRHPLKVSLVLGGLGVIAGWIAIGPLIIYHRFANTTNYEFMLQLIPGLALGVIVLVPLLAWEQRSPVVMLIGVLLAFGAGYAHLKLIDFFISNMEGPFIENFAIAGALAGIVYAVAGISVNRRREWWMLAPLMAISGGLHAANAATQDSMLSLPVPYDIDILIEMSLAANVFAGVYAALGITLGAALWDRTAPEKFEMEESTDGA